MCQALAVSLLINKQWQVNTVLKIHPGHVARCKLLQHRLLPVALLSLCCVMEALFGANLPRHEQHECLRVPDADLARWSCRLWMLLVNPEWADW